LGRDSLIKNNFKKIIDLVCAKSPLQRKKIQNYLSDQDDTFFYLAEEFATKYLNYLASENIPIDYAVDSYLKVCNDMLKSQIYFMKTGKYPVQRADEAFENVYNNEQEMTSFMIGLAISQFLWSTHYSMFKCFKDALKKKRDEISSYLEIGPGHGLFLDEAMAYLKEDAKITVVDISATSIKITKSIMKFFHQSDYDRIEYHNIDMLDLELNETYDFIAMGEVIEHVNYPEKLLNKLRDLLYKKGTAFISTCVDCPTIDHVFHFKSVDQIRKMLAGCGLLIEDERVLPVEDLPMEEIIKRRITINYCAIVRRA